MSDDKDSAVLPTDQQLKAAATQMRLVLDDGYDDETAWASGLEAAALRQPTQSDALLEGDTQTILYLLGVRHGREDERAKVAAEASQPKKLTVSVVSAADGKTMNTFKINPAEKTYVRPEHSLFGYVFEPEEEQSK
jgi:hypothetical protein